MSIELFIIFHVGGLGAFYNLLSGIEVFFMADGRMAAYICLHSHTSLVDICLIRNQTTIPYLYINSIGIQYEIYNALAMSRIM